VSVAHAVSVASVDQNETEIRTLASLGSLETRTRVLSLSLHPQATPWTPHYGVSFLINSLSPHPRNT